MGGFFAPSADLQTQHMNKTLALLVLSGAVFAACTDDTSSIGMDVMPNGDQITTSSATYQLTSTTVKMDSVLANTSKSHIGSIIDPEMHVRTTCNFLAQFHVPDNFTLPSKDKLYMPTDGKVEADSCALRIFFDEYYGDSLATMKLNVRSLSKEHVMEEDTKYYTNLDPAQYVETASPIEKSVSYAVKNLAVSSSLNSGTKYYRSVVVMLPASYGTYLMEQYYADPTNFSNTYKFIHNVCPGFYFQSTGGVGSMITANMMSLDVYFRYHSTTTEGNDTIIDGMQRMGATEEVIQNTRVENNYPQGFTPDDLANATCSYVKTPASLFTEATLPVSDIVAGTHYTDSINQVKIVMRRYNVDERDDYNLSCPQYLLMVRKGKMKSFFEENKLTNSIDSYLTQYSSSNNVYQFSNIARLITTLKQERDEGAGVVLSDTEAQRQAKYAVWEAANPDWNKVMLIPVDAEYATITSSLGTSSKQLMRIRHNLGLTSARLEGGKDNPVEVSVIYGTYNRK